MKRIPVTVFFGGRRLSVPGPVIVVLLGLLIVSISATTANRLLPKLLGTAPVLPVPAPLDALMLGLAYLSGLALLIRVIIGVLGHLESRRADRRFTDFRRLVPLSALLDQTIIIAPNFAQAQRSKVIEALHRLSGDAGVSSIRAPASGSDLEDGSVDRLFVTTTHDPARFRNLVRPLLCDSVERVPARAASRLAGQADPGASTVWLLTWD